MRVLVAIWSGLVFIGGWTLYTYTNLPGPVGDVPELWPLESKLERSLVKPNLIMFAHPRCSCSRASLNELSIILAKAKKQASVQVVFYKPRGMALDWVESDLWFKARNLPGVSTVVDLDGREARKFGAMTSGHTVLYGKGRELLFSGGITDSRAHEGDNLGRTSVIDLLLGRIASVGITKTFGCELFHGGEAEEFMRDYRLNEKRSVSNDN